jgi:hypothetical protein
VNKLFPVALAIGAIVSVAIPTASAEPDECRYAVSRYNSVLSDISSSLRRYANCVSESQGRDDCGSEFRHLRSAQDDFESAVSHFRGDCD